MLSNQILQRTINEIGDIIECNCSIWNTDGVMLAAVGKEKPAVKKAVCSFLKELEVTGVSEEHLDVPEYLTDGGWLVMEIGYDQSADVEKLLKETGFEQVSTQKDLAGLDRVVCGVYNRRSK